MELFYVFAFIVALIWIGALFLKSKRRAKSKAGKWFEKGMDELKGPTFIMGVFALEFAIFVGTLVPYIRYGCPKEVTDYALFSLPCAAGLAAGAGLFFQANFSADANVKAFVVSGCLLAIAYIVEIHSADFLGQIGLWDILMAVAASLVGLSILLYFKDCTEHPLEGLVSPMIIGLGGVILLAGVIFYFSAGPLKASAWSGQNCDHNEATQDPTRPKQACCPH